MGWKQKKRFKSSVEILSHCRKIVSHIQPRYQIIRSSFFAQRPFKMREKSFYPLDSLHWWCDHIMNKSMWLRQNFPYLSRLLSILNFNASYYMSRLSRGAMLKLFLGRHFCDCWGYFPQPIFFLQRRRRTQSKLKWWEKRAWKNFLNFLILDKGISSHVLHFSHSWYPCWPFFFVWVVSSIKNLFFHFHEIHITMLFIATK